jgi:hypothetical protein
VRALHHEFSSRVGGAFLKQPRALKTGSPAAASKGKGTMPQRLAVLASLVMFWTGAFSLVRSLVI